MIQVTCACGATMQVQDENAGKQCKCPKCGAICQISAAGAAAPAAAAPPPAAAPPAAAAPVAAKRPGGLTALAVLNFVFGGFGLIGAVILLAAGSFISAVGNSAARSSGDPNAVRAMEQATNHLGGIYVVVIMALIIAVLAIVSGIGYIKQSKTKGYVFGNIYAIVGVVWVGLQLATGGVMAIGSILGLAYPVITLALLNTSFKNSFPNP